MDIRATYHIAYPAYAAFRALPPPHSSRHVQRYLSPPLIVLQVAKSHRRIQPTSSLQSRSSPVSSWRKLCAVRGSLCTTQIIPAGRRTNERTYFPSIMSHVSDSDDESRKNTFNLTDALRDIILGSGLWAPARCSGKKQPMSRASLYKATTLNKSKEATARKSKESNNA